MRKTVLFTVAGSLLTLAGCGPNVQKMANNLNELSCGSPYAGVYYNGKKVEPNKPVSAEAMQRCLRGGAQMTRTTINVDGGGGRGMSTLANSLK